MRIELVDELTDLTDVRRIYESSFPANERMPFEMAFSTDTPGNRIILFYEEKLIGFACVYEYQKSLVFLSYLAVDEDVRGEGCGSEMVRLLLKHYADRKVFLDIELANSEDRMRRKIFYLERGFVATELCYTFNDVTYELLSANGLITLQEFREVIQVYWSEEAERRTTYSRLSEHQ